MFKWFLRLTLTLLVIVVIALLCKDTVLRAIAEHRIRSETGMETRIGRLSSRFFSPVVTLENLRLYNTAEFGGAAFLTIPELHVELDTLPLAQQKLRIKLLRLDVAEVTIVRNESGRTNLFAILDDVRHKSRKGGRDNALHGLEFDGIDVLNLSLGKVQYIDLADSRNTREFPFELSNMMFKDVRSEADLYGVAVMIWLRSGGKFTLPMGEGLILNRQHAVPGTAAP